MRPKDRIKKKSFNRVEVDMHNAIESQERYAEFKAMILPQLRDAVKSGMTTEQIYKKFSSLAAARTVTIALSAQDSSNALAAIKEMQDRAHGKPKEIKEHSHKYASLTDSEVDALMESRLKEAGSSAAIELDTEPDSQPEEKKSRAKPIKDFR